MADFVNASASIRVVNYDKKSVCSINRVNAYVTAETAAAFFGAIEKIYNSGECTAKLNISKDIVR